MKFSIKDFFTKCDQTRRQLVGWGNIISNIFETFFSFHINPNDFESGMGHHF